MDNDLRKQITQAAVNAAKACGYYNAGTIEFLMDKNKNFYFLEMNTRLQVEHPVTELISGLDLVKEQINIACGNPVSFDQENISINGHALECRVYAEDVDNNFSPSMGKILHHKLPSGPGVRVDRGIDLLSEVSVFYDPLLSKVVTWGKNRDEAIKRMERALGEYQIAGVITNIHACIWVINHEYFRDGSFDINFMEKEFLPLVPDKWKDKDKPEYEDIAAIFGALLKDKEKELKPVSRDCSPQNKWMDTSYE